MQWLQCRACATLPCAWLLGSNARWADVEAHAIMERCTPAIKLHAAQVWRGASCQQLCNAILGAVPRAPVALPQEQP